MELKCDPKRAGMKANNLLLVIFIILVCIAKGSAQQACPAPDNDWLPTDLGHGYFQYAPPPEGQDIQVKVTFKPPEQRQPPGIRKHILIKQGNWVAGLFDSKDGLHQTGYIQSDGTNPIEFEFRECATDYWGAQYFSGSGQGDRTRGTYTAEERGGEAKFELAWGPSIARPQSPGVPGNDDVATALTHIRWAWNDHGPCTRFILCATYFDHVEIRFFENGRFVFKSAPTIRRWDKSAHDCIKEAKKAVSRFEYPLAVEWVMASQIHNPPVKEWLRTHGDAVIAALRQL